VGRCWALCLSQISRVSESGPQDFWDKSRSASLTAAGLGGFSGVTESVTGSVTDSGACVTLRCNATRHLTEQVMALPITSLSHLGFLHFIAYPYTKAKMGKSHAIRLFRRLMLIPKPAMDCSITLEIVSSLSKSMALWYSLPPTKPVQ